MHTAEEVREISEYISNIADKKKKEMLLAYADLLEAMEWAREQGYPLSSSIDIIRQRAAEKARNRK